MQRRIITGLLASTLAVCSAVSLAAERSYGPLPIEQQMQRMQSELGLTDEQARQINAIQQAQHDRMNTLRNGIHAQIRSVLTDEQTAGFDQMQQRPHGDKPMNGQRPPPPDGQMQPPPPHNGRGKMATRMQQELGLTSEQANQIENIRQSERAEMKKLRQETDARIRQVLTIDQTEKFDQMHMRGFEKRHFQR